MLDQTDVWIDPEGYAHRIDLLDEDSVLWSLDYCFANARLLREMWSKEKKETYDVSQRARRWIFDRAVVRALMRQLIITEAEPKEVVVDE